MHVKSNTTSHTMHAHVNHRDLTVYTSRKQTGQQVDLLQRDSSEQPKTVANNR